MLETTLKETKKHSTTIECGAFVSKLLLASIDLWRFEGMFLGNPKDVVRVQFSGRSVSPMN